MSRYRYLAAVCLVALGLHVHSALTLGESDGGTPSAFALGVLAWSLLPYVVCLVTARVTMHIGPALAAAIVILSIDTATYFSALSSSDGQTGLAFVFMPLWNLIIFVPATILIGEITVHANSARAMRPNPALNRTGRYAARRWSASARPAG